MAQKCLSDGALVGYLDSELESRAREFVQRHIASCQKCSERPVLFGLIDDMVRKIYSDEILEKEAHLARLSPLGEKPSLEQLDEWFSSETCEATDGCIIEHDGMCPHGCPSWLKHLGLI